MLLKTQFVLFSQRLIIDNITKSRPYVTWNGYLFVEMVKISIIINEEISFKIYNNV